MSAKIVFAFTKYFWHFHVLYINNNKKATQNFGWLLNQRIWPLSKKKLVPTCINSNETNDLDETN